MKRYGVMADSDIPVNSNNDRQSMYNRYTKLFFLFLTILITSLTGSNFSLKATERERTPEFTQREAERRKFDYFFYEAMNAKALRRNTDCFHIKYSVILIKIMCYLKIELSRIAYVFSCVGNS